MRTKSDIVFLLMLFLTVAAIWVILTPLSTPIRPDITVKATLTK